MDAPAPEDSDLEARAQSRIGAVLQGKYRLNRVLGVGGMATVYAATHRNGKEVALKLLHPEYGFNSDIRSRFLREGHVANHVQHPGAVSVIDDDVTGEGCAFLVMELLHGMTVEDLWAARVVLNPALVVAIVLALLDVMGAAHEGGVIHRDLKPANLFLTLDGELKVLDFGIARLRAAADHKTTNAGTLLGTPAFMAPEQAMAKVDEIDERTDIWAIGSVAFALLVGDIVHPADNAQQTLVLAATKPARSLSALAPSVPTEVAKVFEKALSFERSERWGGACAMRQALLDAARDAYGEIPSAELVRSTLAVVGLGSAPHLPTLDGKPVVAARSRATSASEIERVSTIPGGVEAIADPRILSTTGSGVSSVPPVLTRVALSPTARWRTTLSTRRILFGAGAMAAAMLTLTGMTRSPEPAPVVVSMSKTPTFDVPSSSIGALEGPPAFGSADEATESDDRLAAADSPAAAPRPAGAPPEPIVASSSGPRATPSATRSVATSGPASRPGCAPPFVIQPKTGRKLWKLECL